MSYKGFNPGTGISSTTAEKNAPVVKKVVTDKGIIIVNGENSYTVSGVRVK